MAGRKHLQGLNGWDNSLQQRLPMIPMMSLEIEQALKTSHSTRNAVTIAVLTSDYLVQIGLKSIVDTIKHTRLVSHAAGALRCEEFLRRETPQVVIIDMEPEMQLAELIREIRTAGPSAKIILLLSTLEGLDRAREADPADVDAFVLKVQPPSVLAGTIQCFIRSASEALSSEAAETDRSMLRQPSRFTAVIDPHHAPATSLDLTKREREVLTVLGQGLSNKQIADRLHISEVTVRHHLTAIYGKLGVTSRQKLLIRAYHYSLIDLTVPAA